MSTEVSASGPFGICELGSPFRLSKGRVQELGRCGARPATAAARLTSPTRLAASSAQTQTASSAPSSATPLKAARPQTSGCPTNSAWLSASPYALGRCARAAGALATCGSLAGLLSSFHPGRKRTVGAFAGRHYLVESDAVMARAQRGTLSESGRTATRRVAMASALAV